MFDALEDAAFSEIHDLSGDGTVDYLLHKVTNDIPQKNHIFEEVLKYYKLRIVLTAHPTQFYSNLILGIISDLSVAIKDNNLDEIRSLFLQMGLTRFGNKNKPTPIDEARSLIWYLQSVFYTQISKIQAKLPSNNINLEIGFWPGGDRDGNPFVIAKTTIDVATKLRKSILRMYFNDLKNLRHKLTFDGVYEKIIEISDKIIHNKYQDHTNIIDELNNIVEQLNTKYQGLFVNLVEDLILKVKSTFFNSSGTYCNTNPFWLTASAYKYNILLYISVVDFNIW